jgi:GT2 family glycosyltransferase
VDGVPDVSYAVVLTREVKRAATAIGAIAAQQPASELLLVLNDADDEMRAYARTLEADGARVLHDGADLGIVLGWNLALREARSPHVCVVHEDSEPAPGCAARLLQTLRERPDAGAVGPRVQVGDGSEVGEGSIVWSDGATSFIPALPCDVHAVDYASSSCLMLRREAAIGVGGFDERFFPAAYVDAVLGVSLWRAGRSVLCDRRAVNVHRRGAMVDETRGPRRGARMRTFLFARNRRRFQTAFADWLACQPHRSDEADARSPQPSELAAGLARARGRERDLLAAPRSTLADRLVLPVDVAGAALVLRRALEDEFLAELIDCERALGDETRHLHGAYAELHAELERVHRAYAALWDDRERLRELASAHELVSEEHA